MQSAVEEAEKAAKAKKNAIIHSDEDGADQY